MLYSLTLKSIFHYNDGGLRWTILPTRNFALGISTMSVSKMLKFALPLTRNLNMSQWNIGCVGSPDFGAHVGHVHFVLFVSISFALGSQRECSF